MAIQITDTVERLPDDWKLSDHCAPIKAYEDEFKARLVIAEAAYLPCIPTDQARLQWRVDAQKAAIIAEANKRQHGASVEHAKPVAKFNPNPKPYKGYGKS